MDGWEVTQNKPSVSQAAPIETVMIEDEIIEAEEERLQALEKQKLQRNNKVKIYRIGFNGEVGKKLKIR